MARPILALLMMLLVVLGAGCGGDGDSSSSDAGDKTAAASTDPSPPAATATVAGRATGGPASALGCDGGIPRDVPAGQTVRREVESGGRLRSYVLFVPRTYSARRAAPLVLNFHGRGSTGSQQHSYSGLAPIAEREGFVLASPDGINNSWLLTPGADDIQFARDLVEQLSADLCIDGARVYSTGMSNGGFMSMWLACRAGDLVAAVAPVAGVSGPPGGCGQPVPFLEFHGTDDQLVRFEGGPLPGGFTGQPVPVAMASWAKLAGCGEGTTSRVSASVELRTFAGCSVPVSYYVVLGGGHTWPGSPVPVPALGTTTSEISAQELIWAFFAANPKKP